MKRRPLMSKWVMDKKLIEQRLERVDDLIESKQQEIKTGWADAYPRYKFRSKALILEQEIKDLEALIDYDIDALAKDLVIEPEKRFSNSLIEDKPRPKDVPKGTPLRDLF